TPAPRSISAGLAGSAFIRTWTRSQRDLSDLRKQIVDRHRPVGKDGLGVAAFAATKDDGIVRTARMIRADDLILQRIDVPHNERRQQNSPSVSPPSRARPRARTRRDSSLRRQRVERPLRTGL